MKVVKISRKSINTAIQTLKNGGLIIYPTETCYGIGADATNPKAVKKVYDFKGQRRKPILVAVSDKKMAQDYVELNQAAESLYKNFLPGPVAVVSKSKGKLTKILEGGTGNLGIRIPAFPIILSLIQRFGKPITSTSANTSGKKTPYSLEDIKKYTSDKKLKLVDLFLDAGRLPQHPPSTVVDTTLNEPAILRQGEITIPNISGQNFISNSEEETKKIAGQIFERCRNLLENKPLIFALQGELGSGKTRFAKGLAKALGIKVNVPSPTFALCREYPFRTFEHSNIRTFFHLDTWRMQEGEELKELGFEKMLKSGNVIAIEWLQKVKPILKKSKALVIWITIETISETKRRIRYKV